MSPIRSSATPLVLIHGGAGSRRPTPFQLDCLAETLRQGYSLLQNGQSAAIAVEQIIRTMERSGLFNAGLGSYRQLDGVKRMDAAIMEGDTLRAGAVGSLEGYLHPISAAKQVMTQTDHVLIVGRHAKRLAGFFGLERLPRPTDTDPPIPQSGRKTAVNPQSISLYQKSLTLYKKMKWYDTVGAVALDQRGNLAAGASTGGVSVMLPGRVGDTPLIGSGVYADNSAAAISMTGTGESIIRMGMAKWLAILVQNGDSPKQAARKALRTLIARVEGAAGCLIAAPQGTFAIQHTTPWMAAGYWNGHGKPVVKDRFSSIPHTKSSKGQ